MQLIDRFNRKIDYLRISLTDKCNYKCIYCNPGNSYSALKQNSVLSIDEIAKIVSLFVNELDFKKVRLTGGEPTVRKDILELFKKLYEIKLVKNFELTITTNGSLIENVIPEMKSLGLDRINFSLDSLNPVTNGFITGSNTTQKTIKAIEAADEAGLSKIKINTVIMKGVNDKEIFDFINFFRLKPYYIRFIEYMPFNGNNWSNDYFINSNEIKSIIEEKYILNQLTNEHSSVSKDYGISGYPLNVSFISSMSDHFCGECNRIRITSDGELKLCLFSKSNDKLDIKELLRFNTPNDQIIRDIVNFIKNKDIVRPEISELKLLKDNDMIRIGG